MADKLLRFTKTHINSYGGWTDGVVLPAIAAEAEYLLKTFPKNFTPVDGLDAPPNAPDVEGVDASADAPEDQVTYLPDVPPEADVTLPETQEPASHVAPKSGGRRK